MNPAVFLILIFLAVQYEVLSCGLKQPCSADQCCVMRKNSPMCVDLSKLGKKCEILPFKELKDAGLFRRHCPCAVGLVCDPTKRVCESLF